MVAIAKPAYELKPGALSAYLLLTAVAGWLALASNNPGARIVDIEALLPGFYGHTSNLLLSAGLVLVYCLVRIIYGARMRELVIFALVVIGANYLYEGALTLWNTKDLVDAHYGAVSSLVVLGIFFVIKQRGLKPVRN